MSSNTVAEFANELKKTSEQLIEQLEAAGVPKRSASDVLTEADKQKLLNHLQASHGTGERRKIVLTKKSTSEIKQADATGKARTIQVEVRKKRTFVKRDDDDTSSNAAAQQQAELARREEAAREQAEQLRQQEEALERSRREREAEAAAAAAKPSACRKPPSRRPANRPNATPRPRPSRPARNSRVPRWAHA
jgi:translation initiation factor IF-2